MFNSYRLLPAQGIEPRSGREAEKTRERFPAQRARRGHAPKRERAAQPHADSPRLHHL